MALFAGAMEREKRPAFDNFLKDANRRKFDLVAAWSVDRLGRSLKDLLSFLDAIHTLGIDTTTPDGKAMFQLCGVFAEFERSMIRERISAGLGRARSNGKRLRRPRVRSEVEEDIRQAFDRRDKGIRKIARGMGVQCGTKSQSEGSSGLMHRDAV